MKRDVKEAGKAHIWNEKYNLERLKGQEKDLRPMEVKFQVIWPSKVIIDFWPNPLIVNVPDKIWKWNLILQK